MKVKSLFKKIVSGLTATAVIATAFMGITPNVNAANKIEQPLADYSIEVHELKDDTEFNRWYKYDSNTVRYYNYDKNKLTDFLNRVEKENNQLKSQITERIFALPGSGYHQAVGNEAYSWAYCTQVCDITYAGSKESLSTSVLIYKRLRLVWKTILKLFLILILIIIIIMEKLDFSGALDTFIVLKVHHTFMIHK